MDPTVRVRVPSVQRVFVVEMLEDAESLLRIRGPLQHRLSPEHSQRIVHPAIHQVGVLGSIPELIAGLRLLLRP